MFRKLPFFHVGRTRCSAYVTSPEQLFFVSVCPGCWSSPLFPSPTLTLCNWHLFSRCPLSRAEIGWGYTGQRVRSCKLARIWKRWKSKPFFLFNANCTECGKLLTCKLLIIVLNNLSNAQAAHAFMLIALSSAFSEAFIPQASYPQHFQRVRSLHDLIHVCAHLLLAFDESVF